MSVKTVTAETFEKEVLQSECPVIVKFFATWCGPCKTFGVTFETLASEYESKQIKFVQLDVDASPDLADEYKIKSLPTAISFRQAAEGKRLGNVKIEVLRAEAEHLLSMAEQELMKEKF